MEKIIINIPFAPKLISKSELVNRQNGLSVFFYIRAEEKV